MLVVVVVKTKLLALRRGLVLLVDTQKVINYLFRIKASIFSSCEISSSDGPDSARQTCSQLICSGFNLSDCKR
jgi:hypothetical protein